MDKLMREKENIAALNQLLTDVLDTQTQALKQMRKAIIITIICFTAIICIGILGFFWYESQFEESSVTTTTFSTEGDSSGISHDIYNDNSTHTEENN